MSETPHTPTPEAYLSMVKTEVNEESSDPNRLYVQLHCPPEAIPIYLKRLLRDVEQQDINSWSRPDPEGAKRVLEGGDEFVDDNLEDILSQDYPVAYREVRFHMEKQGDNHYDLTVVDNFNRGLLQREGLTVVPPPPSATQPTT